MKEIQQKYKARQEAAERGADEVLPENNINPAASCLPLLAQFPVFISLYFVLKHFSKHQPGDDLSWLDLVPNITDHAIAHWSGYLLLAIYAASQLASTYFMSATMDKAQRIMHDDPADRRSSRSSLNFPIGLVIYWVTTNLWTVGQGPRHAAPDAEARRRRRAPLARAHRRRRPRHLRPRSRRPSRSRRRADAGRPPAQPRRVKRKKRRRDHGDDGGLAGRGDRRDRRRGEVGGAARAREARSPGSTRPRSGSRSSPRASAGCSASATRRRV